MLKKDSLKILFYTVFFVVLFPVYSQSNYPLRVGFLPGYGVHIDPVTQKPAGYTVDYFSEVSKHSDMTFSFIACDWEEGLEMLKRGELDFFGPMQKTEERLKHYGYTDKEMGYEYCLLYAPKNTAYHFEDFQNFNNITIASFAENSFNAFLEEYALNNNFYYNLLLTKTTTAFDELQAGKFDALLYSSLVEMPDTVIIGKIQALPYYFATEISKTELLSKFNKAIENIFFFNPYFAAELTNKYFSAKSINAPAFTREEKDFITAHPSLRVVHNPSLKPIEYINSKTKEMDGISISILKEISRITGISFETIKTKNYTDSVAAVSRGDADIITGYPEELKNSSDIVLSNTYLEIPIILVKTSAPEQRRSPRAAVPGYNTLSVRRIKEDFSHFTFIQYEDSNACLDALLRKEVQYAFLNSYAFDEFVRNSPYTDYSTIHTGITYPLQIGLSKNLGSHGAAAINKAISRISDETKQTIIYANTIERTYRIPFSVQLRHNAVQIIVIILIFFGILTLTIYLLGQKTKKRLRTIAYVDELTGLRTLSKFKKDIKAKLYYADPDDYMIISFDIDNFKYINDSFGFEIGNAVLAELGVHFKDFEGPDDFICRSFADYFLFFTRKKNWNDLITKFAELTSVKNSLSDLLSEHYEVSFSAGVYYINNLSLSVTGMIDKATIARKSVKGLHYKSAMVEYTPKMDNEIEWQKEITLAMDNALINQEFLVYYQPKYLFSTSECIGAEALIRWSHKEKGLLPPNTFLPLFEKNGFIQKLDIFVFENVCRFLAKWMKEGHKPVVISCNLSRLHLQNPRLTSILTEIADKYGVSTEFLEIELTESLMHHDIHNLIETMLSLKKAGFKISIDDFGSGYSSLNMLKDIPADVLKIDKEFLSRSTENPKGAIILSSIVTMAKQLNLRTIAEGVEIIEEVTMLKRIGCEMVQGYYYAKPMPVNDFNDLLLSKL